MQQDPNDCTLCDFDQDDNGNNIFPLDETFDNEDSRNAAIFKILQNIYDYGHFHHYAPINIDDWKLTVDPKREEQILALYKKYIDNFESDFTANINLCTFLAMSPINDFDFPFLLSLVDSYTRDRIDYKFIQKPARDLKEEDWIQCKKRVTQLNNKLNKHLDLKSAIARYQQRIAPQFTFDPPYLINDSLKECAVYIVAFGNFVNQLMTAQKSLPPFMIDFMLALSPNIKTCADKMNESNHNLSDDHNEQKDKGMHLNNIDRYKDCIGDIISDLNDTKCLYHKTNIKQQIDVDAGMEPILILRTKLFQNALREFSTTLSKNGHNTMSYPQHERFCVVVDRRKRTETEYKNEFEHGNQSDDLLIFQPPNDCNSFPKGSYPPEIYFERSKQCLLPKVQKTQRITSRCAASGQLLTFSFHVRARDNIKCYLLWNGQSMRFYPSDIVHVLAKIFVDDQYGNDEFISGKEAKSLSSQMNINDSQFERFYCGLSNKQLHEFPIKYNVNFEEDD